jgi:hypothetical protein
MVTAGSNAAGGTARWKSRRGEPPSSSLARPIAAASGAASPGCALPNDSARAKAPHASPAGLVVPNSATDWRACSRNCSLVRARRAEPTIRYLPGSRPATNK